MFNPKLSNPFYIKPIYTGDADEGTEGICGHERHYNVDGVIYITQDDNKNEEELLVEKITEDYL